jgi:hypothetical protein
MRVLYSVQQTYVRLWIFVPEVPQDFSCYVDGDCGPVLQRNLMTGSHSVATSGATHFWGHPMVHSIEDTG